VRRGSSCAARRGRGRGRGVDELGRIFRWLGSRFADCTADRFELVGAGVSGDLAYTVGYEHAAASMDGAPTQYTLRATHLYRREHGEWKIVHRHGNFPPVDDRPFAEVSAKEAVADG
jgi:hypothetical protein